MTFDKSSRKHSRAASEATAPDGSRSHSSRRSSSSSSSRASSSSRRAHASTSKKGARAKFEDFDVAEALKTVQLPPAAAAVAVGASSTTSTTAEEARVVDVGAAAIAAPHTASVYSSSSGSHARGRGVAGEEEMVPLAAVVAVDVDRASEAVQGMLKEPAAPPPSLPRVTREGEGAPPLPTELMQLLSG